MNEKCSENRRNSRDEKSRRSGIRRLKTAQIGDLDNDVLITPRQHFAELDQPDPILKVIGQQGSLP